MEHGHTGGEPRSPSDHPAITTNPPELSKPGLESQPQLRQTSYGSNALAKCPDGNGAVITKPANDEMNYRHMLLPNGLRVMLVSDPTTDKAGAAMDVRVGSLSDPDSFPGLAHFTEHMLFFSSEKYPVEDEYTKFISDHGGSTNAYTAAEHTNYHFDVNWEALEGALDRFAQFFIAPTISEDGIEREVLAVDSEHVKNLSSDAWRKIQVSRATANPQHPWSRFSTGNQETLFTRPKAEGADPRVAVLDFYNQHYSADRCALAVLGRQPLEELEAMVRALFAPVPNKQLLPPAFASDVFLPEQTGVLLRVVPVREGQSLELVWQVPAALRAYREQPLGYLSHLLGHEGEGSVFALLKARGWANALWAGEGGGGLSFASFFTVHVELTEEGQRHIRQVAATVFRYIAMLRQPGGISERVYEEVRGLAQLQFDTRDKSRPLTYCTNLSNGLQLYPPQDMLPAMYGVPSVFSPAAIRESLELLTPERVRLFWISKAHLQPPSGDTSAAAPAAAAAGATADEISVLGGGGELRTEPWYGTRYDVSPLPAERLQAWQAARPEEEPRLHLPAPNPFIPTDLSLASLESAAAPPHPVVALAVPGRIRLWHKLETRFGQPKAVLNVNVHSPEAYTSPRAAVMTRLFTKLMLDYLNEVAYPAQQAGLDYNLLNTQSGWQLSLGGFNHKLPDLLGEVLGRLADFKVLPDRFEFVREGLVREYANQMHNQPYSWAMYRGEMLTTVRRWPLELYGKMAAEVSAEELQAFVVRLHSRCFVEGLAAGNLRRAEVLRCGRLLLTCLRDRCGAAPLHPAEAPELRIAKIPPGPPQPSAAAQGGGGGVENSGGGCNGWLFAEEGPSGTDENSAAVVVYQRGPDDHRSNALGSLLVHLAKRDAFSELRTRQQLGYVVSLHGGREHGVGFMELVVQSSSYSSEELCGRMDDFIAGLLDTELPKKCGLEAGSQAPAHVQGQSGGGEQQEEEQEQQATAAEVAATTGPPTEFEIAVEELAKSKLQAPKKLGDLVGSWWSEVNHGTYCFDRKEAEVAELRALTPAQLLAFAREQLTPGSPHCRKLSIQVRGNAEATRREQAAAATAAAASPAPNSAEVTAAGSSGGVAPADDNPLDGSDAAPAAGNNNSRSSRRLPYAIIPSANPFSWKRGCEAWPAVRALWAARRAAEGQPPLTESVSEAEVAETGGDGSEAEVAPAPAGPPGEVVPVGNGSG